MFSIGTFVILGTLLLVTYWYVRRIYTYWKRKGVHYVEPSIPYGNMKGLYSTYHQYNLEQELYDQLKGCGPFGGIYYFNSPVALVLDPKLIKNILIRDFQCFMDRGVFYNKKYDPLSANLFSLDAAEWKGIRNKLTSSFTASKMKYMCPIVTRISNEFVDAVENHLKTSDIVEIQDFLGRYTTDVIGTCAFGIECNSLQNPDAIFRQMGREIFSPQRWQWLKDAVYYTSAMLSTSIGLKLLPTNEISEFYLKTFRDIVNYREQNHVQRNDYMNLLIQLMNEKSADRLSFNEVAAQAFIFFVAGFETSSLMMTFTLYELALNPDIQSKARKEVTEVLQEYKGELTYEALMDLKYIDQIFNESLRKYPPATSLIRRTTKDYPVPDTNVTLDSNTLVWIPVRAIHHDPEYYPEPDKFNPDRFTPEAILARDPMTYLPFGDGPRNCMGLRFAQMEILIALVKILENFIVSPCAKTPIPIVYDTKSFMYRPLGGLWLKLKKI